MSALNVLLRARFILSEPTSWTQKVYAKDKDGQQIFTCHESACAWCAEGALIRAQSDLGFGSGAIYALEKALPEDVQTAAITEGKAAVPFYNDTEGRTHAEILDLFDKAIEAERSR